MTDYYTFTKAFYHLIGWISLVSDVGDKVWGERVWINKIREKLLKYRKMGAMMFWGHSLMTINWECGKLFLKIGEQPTLTIEGKTAVTYSNSSLEV